MPLIWADSNVSSPGLEVPKTPGASLNPRGTRLNQGGYVDGRKGGHRYPTAVIGINLNSDGEGFRARGGCFDNGAGPHRRGFRSGPEAPQTAGRVVMESA